MNYEAVIEAGPGRNMNDDFVKSGRMGEAKGGKT
jgi:hypothetical protein